MWAHLWAGDTPPIEYVNMRFYREFGWTPDQLKAQEAPDILAILVAWEIEGKVRKLRGK